MNSEDLSLMSQNRGDILDVAKQLTYGDRNKTYGPPKEAHERLAKLLGAYLEIEMNAQQAAMVMVLIKVSRTISSPDHMDNYVDGAAYFAISGECA